MHLKPLVKVSERYCCYITGFRHSVERNECFDQYWSYKEFHRKWLMGEARLNSDFGTRIEDGYRGGHNPVAKARPGLCGNQQSPGCFRARKPAGIWTALSTEHREPAWVPMKARAEQPEFSGSLRRGNQGILKRTRADSGEQDVLMVSNPTSRVSLLKS